jgi:hypothetical protein
MTDWNDVYDKCLDVELQVWKLKDILNQLIYNQYKKDMDEKFGVKEGNDEG